MEKVLGIDLGTNSIGWAIRDTTVEGNQIIDKGVLTFEKGVGEGKSGEFPMVQKRTEARHKRRNYQAEKYRKYSLLECLIENKMCPLTIDELNKWRHYKKGIGRKYPQSEKFIQWLRFDFDGDGKPDFENFGFDIHENFYLFRMLAASEQLEHQAIFKRNPQILGRVFYHLVQRRGFKGRDEGEAKTMMQGNEKTGTIGRNAIAVDIAEYKTLGAALYYLCKEKKERIRKRYNLRSDFEDELETICKIQNVEHDVYKKLWKAIIWQRPLRSQKGLVGICTFEKNKARCPISHPLYEEFRAWVNINNWKIELPESVDKLRYLEEKIYPVFFKSSNDFELSVVAKVLDKDGGIIKGKFAHGAKDEKGKWQKNAPDTKVISCRLSNDLKNILGNNWKTTVIETKQIRQHRKKDGNLFETKITYNYEDIWHVLFSFDDDKKLKEFAERKLNLSEEQTDKFSKIRLQQGYATLSLSAINKILPYLKRGFIYSHAVYLANLPKVFGETKITDELIDGFVIMIEEIKKVNDKEKLLNSVINDLIRSHLNNENRYRIENDRELDSQEKDLIEGKLIEVIGSKSWNDRTEFEKSNLKVYCENHFKDFLKKSFNGKKDELFLTVPNLHDRIFNYLKEEYGISESRKKYLWHPSEQETYLDAKQILLENGVEIKQLGDPQPTSRGFKNPMALKTLHKLKGLINYLLEVGKIEEDDRIVIEIARELNDANKRKAIEKWQKARETENEEFKSRIDEINLTCKTNYNREDKNLIDKVRLWVEQNQQCIYTGKTIGLCDLFNGVKFDFEHTIPASMSFDNELKNLTIADSLYNREVKKKQIPFDLPNYETDALGYAAIKPRLQFLFDKVESLERLYDEWKFKAKFASTKEIRDATIQRRHLIKMDLDYWRKKLETFTCKEYKVGWRNSQLRDTQIVTKYALPYLKTIFKKAEVQKGSVTATFREIYKIQPRLERKDRSKHSHHAIDAAVLTIIPTSPIRDKILLAYNEEKDNNTGIVYHERPRGWKEFDPRYILEIENDVLINYQSQNRQLTHTKKNVRKRGKQQFVKTKDDKGKWHFKLDKNNKKIPLVADGDSIRGQLHKESFYGAIKLGDELTLVERYPISEFTNINDCKNIIDVKVRELVKTTLEKRIADGQNFEKAKLEPISFPSGKAVIKKVRCKVAAGRGYLTPQKALPINTHDFIKKNKNHEYKHVMYAQNEENTLCLYYEKMGEKAMQRGFRIVGLFELAKLNLNCISAIMNEPYYYNYDETNSIQLHYIITVGTKAIFFEENIEELKEIKSKKELLKRMYVVYKFNLSGTPDIYLKNHVEAKPNPEIDKECENLFDPKKYQSGLSLKASKFTCAIEGKHFDIKPDGEIKWKF